MDLAIFILAFILLLLLICKTFLHYKLLRIEEDQKVDLSEDYFLSFWMKNEHWLLKVKSGSLTKIESDFSLAVSNELKARINILIKTILLGVIVLLILVLIHQIR